MVKVMATLALFLLYAVGGTFASSSFKDGDEETLSHMAKADRKFELPGKRVLKEKISEIGMDKLLEQTKLLKNLSNKTLTEMAIHMAVETAFLDYYEWIKEGAPPPMVKRTIAAAALNKPDVIEAIIKASKEIEEKK